MRRSNLSHRVLMTPFRGLALSLNKSKLNRHKIDLENFASNSLVRFNPRASDLLLERVKNKVGA